MPLGVYRNQTIRLDHAEFKVIHADERRLTRLRVTLGRDRINRVTTPTPRVGLLPAWRGVRSRWVCHPMIAKRIPLSAGVLFTLLRDDLRDAWRTGLAYGLGFFGVSVSWFTSASTSMATGRARGVTHGTVLWRSSPVTRVSGIALLSVRQPASKLAPHSIRVDLGAF